jgi:hypothetical protein
MVIIIAIDIGHKSINIIERSVERVNSIDDDGHHKR